MNEGDVVEILRTGFRTVMIAAGPAVAAALVTGIVVSVLQTLTQIQEQTLAFVPKIVVTLIVTVIFLPLGFAALRGYMEEIVHLIVAV